MILSAQQLFSDDQAITASADSTNVIDTGVRGTPYDGAAPLHGDIGKGNKICVLVQITADFDNMTSLEIKFSTGATTALGTTIASEVIVLADAVAGKQLLIEVLPNGITERYLGLEYVIVGSAPSVGTVTAGISMGNQTNTTGA